VRSGSIQPDFRERGILIILRSWSKRGGLAGALRVRLRDDSSRVPQVWRIHSSGDDWTMTQVGASDYAPPRAIGTLGSMASTLLELITAPKPPDLEF